MNTTNIGGLKVHMALLAILVLVVIYGILADSEKAALFINGVTFNLVDEWLWIVLAPFSVFIKNQKILFAVLLTVAVSLVALKISMHLDGGDYLRGSIIGELFGVLVVGYVINAAAIVFRIAYTKRHAQ